MKNETADLYCDTWLRGDHLYISDLRICKPSEVLSEGPRRYHWRMLDYVAESIEGTMLIAGPETAAPQVTVPVNENGLHGISIGVLGGSEDVRVLVRLSGDETFTVLTLPGEQDGHRGSKLSEIFFKIEDITDRSIQFGQISWNVSDGTGLGSTTSTPANIAYIKLVQLTELESKRFLEDQNRTDTRRLLAHNDAHTVHFASRPTTPEEIRWHIEPYRDSDIGSLYWEGGIGEQTFYFSKIGKAMTHDGLDDFPRQGDRLFAESWRVLRDKNIDPFEIACEYAHELGLEFHACYRPAGFHFPPPHGHFTHGNTFYETHQNLRCRDRNGNMTPRISYAFPESRMFVVSLLSEMVGYGTDGVCILYNRRPPLVEYDQPLVDEFIIEHGIDPRTLDPGDPRWIKRKATALTSFHRELRDAMDSTGVSEFTGARRKISVIVMSNEEENLKYGMDLETWVKEDLVDVIIPYSSAPDVDSSSHAWSDPRDIDYFVSIARGTSCTVAANMMPRTLTSEEYRTIASGLYGRDVDHLFFWDTDIQQPRSNSAGPWDAARRLGHRDEVEGWIESGSPTLALPKKSLLKLGDWDLSYVTPG